MKNILSTLLVVLLSWSNLYAQRLESELVFPLNGEHNHAPGIVVCPNGDLLASWYRGAGERKADDVRVLGARLPKGEKKWSNEFLLVDTPGFPDCNTCMIIDNEDRLRLYWPIILANSWESCITQSLVSEDYQKPGAPVWKEQTQILLKPDDFSADFEDKLGPFLAMVKLVLTKEQQQEIDQTKVKLHDKLYQRLGWQPRCKPTILKSGRIVLPLYTDTYSISIMAISDDQGETWRASKPLIGFGNIQPAVLERRDGTLVAYMRENGITTKIRVCESKDGGEIWGDVYSSELSNPGSGLDGIRLISGKWLLVYNDTLKGRHSLAVSLSDDEGATWKWTRHLEKTEGNSYHYPAVTQAKDGTIHAIYSYFVPEGKSMKHAAFDEAWVLGAQ